jgi:hypothetical protein
MHLFCYSLTIVSVFIQQINGHTKQSLGHWRAERLFFFSLGSSNSSLQQLSDLQQPPFVSAVVVIVWLPTTANCLCC